MTNNEIPNDEGDPTGGLQSRVFNRQGRQERQGNAGKGHFLGGGVLAFLAVHFFQSDFAVLLYRKVRYFKIFGFRVSFVMGYFVIRALLNSCLSEKIVDDVFESKCFVEDFRVMEVKKTTCWVW